MFNNKWFSKVALAGAIMLGAMSVFGVKNVYAEDTVEGETSPIVETTATVEDFESLQAAFLNENIETIYIANDIDVPCGSSDYPEDYKSKSAALVADRNLTIEGLNGNSYTLKRILANEKDEAYFCRSILEVYGNGIYDDIQVSIKNLVLDGGAVWDETVEVKKRTGSDSRVWNSNKGIAGRAIIDVANKGTINLESGAVLRNSQVSVNSQTRSKVGYSGGGSSCYGAGIRIEYSDATGGGTANLKIGAVIEDCSSVNWGGAIGAYNYGRLNIYGGTISRCTSDTGAAICCTYRQNTSSNTASTMNMYGGTIEDCYGSASRGVINMDGSNPNASVITGGTIRNCTGYAINANEQAKLDIDTTNLIIENMNCSGDAIRINNKDNLVEVNSYTVTFMDGDSKIGSIMVKKDTAAGSSFPGVKVKNGYTFDKWTTESGDVVASDTIITADTTVYANWKNNHVHENFTYEVDGLKLTAVCGGDVYPENCELVDKSVSLQMNYSDSTLSSDATGWYEAENYAFTVDGQEVWETVFDDKSSEIHYVGINDTEYEDSTELPTAAGTYKAYIPANDGSIAVDFAIEHVFGEYVSNEDATVEADGTKTRTCSVCEATETVTDEGTKLPKPEEPIVKPEEPSADKPSADQPSTENPTVKPENPDDGSNTTEATTQPVKKGQVIKSKDAAYTVLVATKGKEAVEYRAPLNKKKATVTIPDTVTINGVKYKVTSIKANAFKNNKKLKKVTIGKNIKKIGKNAFYGCKNLKTVKIKTTKLTKKTVGKNAFAKINKKAKVKVPKKKLKSYKKVLKARGIKAKSQKISK